MQVWVTPSLDKQTNPMQLHRTYGQCHTDVLDVAWSPDGAFLAAASKVGWGGVGAGLKGWFARDGLCGRGGAGRGRGRYRPHGERTAPGGGEQGGVGRGRGVGRAGVSGVCRGLPWITGNRHWGDRNSGCWPRPLPNHSPAWKPDQEARTYLRTTHTSDR